MRLSNVFDKPGVSTGDMWFRPVIWRGSGQAYCVKDGHCYLVPNARGGIRGMTSSVKYLSGEWEVVSPNEVLK